ncbi:MAG: hypothetical protein ACXITR_03300 [Cyanobacterium sp.]
MSHKPPQSPLKSLLWLWQKTLNHHHQEAGNTLIIAVSLGVLLVGATTTMIFTSSRNKTNVASDEFATQALETAETGITRTIDKLSSLYPYFLSLNYNPEIKNPTPADRDWRNPPDDANISVCAPSTSETILTDAILTEELGNGRRYKIQSYSYNSSDDTGTLIVQGINDNGETFSSKAQIEINASIETLTRPNSFPGLYAETVIDLGNNDILSQDPNSSTRTFNIICTDCTSTKPLNCQDGEPSREYLEDAMNIKSNSKVEGDLIIGTPLLPPYPDPPTAICSKTQALPCHIPIGNIGSSTTLPRSTDITAREDWVKDPTSVWYNKASLLSKDYTYILGRSGNDSINISGNTDQRITINSAAAPVRLYVTGNISFSGGASIRHTGTLDRFAIFGCTASLNSITPCLMRDASGKAVQRFSVSGGATTSSAFIYAPNTILGVNGGSANPDFNAVIWADTWDGSKSNQVEIVVPDNAESLVQQAYGVDGQGIGMPYNRIGSITSWQRRQAN